MLIGKDGRVVGGKWSPFGDTDEEIEENLKTGKMPNAPDAKRVGPAYFTGSKKGDETLRDFLGGIGALGGQAKKEYEARKRGQQDDEEEGL